MTPAPITALPWDSALFGFPIARVNATRLDAAALDAALAACRAQAIRCAYLLLDADDAHGSQLAQATGFVVRDVRLELERPLERDTARRAADATAVGPARLEQRPALDALAREAFPLSRFFADPGFPRERCGDLYAAFLARGLDGAPERRTLATADASGFVVCHLDEPRSVGTIELIAVAADARGSGDGSALVAGALETFTAAGLRTAEVVTQAANVASQRLYARAGFRTRRARVWLHRWF
ncbi:MAG TPA: GNAT family N-acetyltransferase [Conexibacter sp.]|nr:GNAT family N-acetyltransferase [Conexibacter sp.]